MRRPDRSIGDEAEITKLMQRARVGFIATTVDNQPYLNSNLFWFDETHHRVYFHTASTGRTRTNIEANPKVCFGLAEMGELLPADTALEFSTEYAGVTVFGQARIVDDADEAKFGLYGLLTKYFPDLKPGQDYRSITPEEIARTSVFAIEIESWSGKQKKKA
ncbi:MAG: pyridoxamine 5'-phosphate oxidase family protein [Anaerolineales bacterium]|nr:MAG: pyridoxamine 5'-phosphate oxidase family protein [Anaerolineales bacterium]